jgi:hypothetical protein
VEGTAVPRPQFISDIEIDNIEFAAINVDKIETDPTLLKGYAAFIEAVGKAGAVIDNTGYRGVVLYRRPSLGEQAKQLADAQRSWDLGEKYYKVYASVGACEHRYEESQAERWAEGEGLPWPPEVEPISPLDAVIRDIDEVTV